MFLHVIACLFLIAVVLLQQGKGQDLASAFGGGGTQTAFGPRGSATVLSRATTILAGVFMVTSLGLSLMQPERERHPRPRESGHDGFADPGRSGDDSAGHDARRTAATTPAAPAEAPVPAATPTPTK